ncbi:MAG: type IX secretion system outer membrane channel protein PorV [Bacteroidaceae bacterium]|nr:type IX secretion system outer membrane channel protein PorV [Bacteroidaceae bacterium]
MNNKKNIVLSLILAFGCYNTIKAQDVKEQFNPVYYGVTSLAIAPDARAGGMGDVGAATDPDVNSQYWNPAKYPFTISRSGIALNYTPWLRQLVDDIDLANLTGYYRFGEYDAVSASLRYFSLGEVMMGNGNFDSEEYGETIKPYEMAVDVAYSRMLSETFSAGVALRYIYSDMAANKYDPSITPGSAFAADLAMYHNGYINLGNHESQLGWGLNINNIGSKISYQDGEYAEFLPTNLRFGMSLMVPLDDYNTISFSGDVNKLLVPTRPTMEQYINETGAGDDDYSGYTSWLVDEGYYNISPISGIFKSFHDAPGGFKEELQEIQWSLGLEYSYNNQFFVRAGYHYEHPNKGNRKYYTLGAGFKMNIFSIDAGYVISAAQSSPLDQTLRFSLAFDMDGLGDLLGKKRR